MATFVLIHGAWHGGWCWNKVIPLLRKKRDTVFAPTLSGVGEKAHLANLVNPRDLDLHIQDVVRLLECEDLRQVILVGHAYPSFVCGAESGFRSVADRVARRAGAFTMSLPASIL